MRHRREKKLGDTAATASVALKFNPFTSFLLLLEVDLLLMLLWGSVYYALYYSVL